MLPLKEFSSRNMFLSFISVILLSNGFFKRRIGFMFNDNKYFEGFLETSMMMEWTIETDGFVALFHRPAFS